MQVQKQLHTNQLWRQELNDFTFSDVIPFLLKTLTLVGHRKCFSLINETISGKKFAFLIVTPCFLWSVFSLIWIEPCLYLSVFRQNRRICPIKENMDTILSIYGEIWIREGPHFGIFHKLDSSRKSFDF